MFISLLCFLSEPKGLISLGEESAEKEAGDNNGYLEDEGMTYYGKIISRNGEQNCIVHFFPFWLKKKKNNKP